MERELFAYTFDYSKPGNLLPQNSKATEMLTEMGQSLQRAVPELRELKIDYFISSDMDVNAFAYPGGFIVMNRGLIEKAESIEEIMGVLAHELAHVERRHSLKAIGAQLSLLVGALVLASLVGSEASTWVLHGIDVSQLSFSRRHELEADELAFAFLLVANVDPQGLPSFFNKLKESEWAGMAALKFLSTHPLTDERLQNLERLSKAAGPSDSGLKLTFDLKDLKNALSM